MKPKYYLGAAFCLAMSACNFSCSTPSSTTDSSSETVEANSVAPGKLAPDFSGDEAYAQILAYEKFGPKVPGTPAHVKAGDWILAELKKAGLTGIEQKATAKTNDGKTIPVRNIIAQVNPEAKTRYLLSAHWDNRPIADEDSDPKFRNQPILGTNDGGSGVVVLLGIAKSLQGKSTPFGVDLLFVDAEDLGDPKTDTGYCLGTEYWVKNPVPANYHAKFGINFDMVGRIGSIFPLEVYSARSAPDVMRKLRHASKQLGYEELFPDMDTGAVVDDHVYLMERGFPVLDLIAMTPDGHFPPEWHTHKDTSEFISRDVLRAVGRTTLQALYNDQ